MVLFLFLYSFSPLYFVDLSILSFSFDLESELHSCQKQIKEAEKSKFVIEAMQKKHQELADFLEEERLVRGEVIEDLQKNVEILKLKLKEQEDVHSEVLQQSKCFEDELHQIDQALREVLPSRNDESSLIGVQMLIELTTQLNNEFGEQENLIQDMRHDILQTNQKVMTLIFFNQVFFFF